MVMALAIMTLVSPYSLLFDLSLQLSFLATIGIVFLFPLLQEKIPRISKSFFGEILVQTIAVNILTLPLIIYQIGYFSFISFPINVIVLGGISLITIGGFVTVLIGMIFFPLGQILALPLQLITDSIIALASFASRHDPFSIQFPQFSIYWIIGIYICIFLLMIRASLQRDTVDISA
jgi:competence protein ComEC